MITLQSNAQTTATIIAIVQKTGQYAGNNYVICWKVGNNATWYSPTLTAYQVGQFLPNCPGQTVNTFITNLNPNYLVLGTNGFAAAASGNCVQSSILASPVFTWNGQSTQADASGVMRLADDIAFAAVINNTPAQNLI